MDCLTSEQIVGYLRGNGTDPRGVEAHVRDCPGCAMELLLAREALRDLRAAKPATARRLPPRRRRAGAPWIVAGAAAAALLALLPALLRRPPAPPPPSPTAIKVQDPVIPPAPPPPEPPKPAPPLKKESDTFITPPVPQPAPEPPKPELPKPEPPKPPAEPAPAPPSPPKPSPPTTVERPVVARVTHAVGSAPGRAILAGEMVSTARQEFLALDVEGVGPLYLRDQSRLEIGAGGELALHGGELLVRAGDDRRVPPVRTPAGLVEPQAPLLGVRAAKDQTDVLLFGGRVSVGAVAVEGPGALRVRAGKPAEAVALDPGFLAWLPDKLAARRFTGWFEAEAGAGAGFRALEMELASGERAMVQAEDRATLLLKAPLPARGRHVLWLRVRQYPAKAVALAVSVNGQALPEIRLEGQEERPWRWIGPVAFTSDRAEVAVAALTRSPHRAGERSFPVAVDAAVVSSDPKFAPPERLGERRAFDLQLDAPGK